ncbi:hypothetical protein SFC79_08430 [Nocardioides sp. S-58]|uniref:Uncharacterized protein n=1 Tax=Nocardioides renjunii TaxID=3095075 RepID=A0ABU5KA56_9ACTN|nr:hypothetical protein [Nocardioides sp. S-58]MDZ5661786.1 hypothetical protein [Nocardioides sp. S-58]
MGADADFTRYLDARWADLVGGLEDEGVPPDEARLAVAETLLASRGSWSRRVREEQVDVSLWAELRERTGLPARPGEPVPHGVRPFDPRDTPAEWLTRAEAARRARRARGARRAVAGLLVAALLAAGWAWWAARPAPVEVRREANPLPVVWYAQNELHLADVVVGLTGVEEFVSWGSGAAARLRSGEVVRVDADGDVHGTDAPPAQLDDPPEAPPLPALGAYDVVVQSAPVPGGGWAHLLDSSRRDGGQDAVRRSESGRRALVVCSADLRCGEPRTIVESGGGTIRLR